MSDLFHAKAPLDFVQRVLHTIRGRPTLILRHPRRLPAVQRAVPQAIGRQPRGWWPAPQGPRLRPARHAAERRSRGGLAGGAV